MINDKLWEVNDSYEGFEISKKNIKNLGISESFHLI